MTFNIYDRATNDLGFLGTVQIKPVLRNDHTVDQWYRCVFSLSVSVTTKIDYWYHSVSSSHFLWLQLSLNSSLSISEPWSNHNLIRPHHHASRTTATLSPPDTRIATDPKMLIFCHKFGP